MRRLEPEDPRELGEYRLLRRLGSGGMGRVYLGRSVSGRTVAVKVVHPHFATDEQFRARFRREVDSARRVGGDWTAPVLDADPEAPLPWVVTGYVAGPPLSDALQEYGPLPENTVRAMGAGLAEALHHVHGLGLVHRDVKPSNVLLTVDGPRLIDFGIARATDSASSLTSSGVSIGSPGYMSPEQVLGQGAIGPSDVFSLGAVLAYAATRKTPFPGDSSAALLYRVVHEAPDLDGLDGDLREVIERCLAKDPAARPLPWEVARELAGPAGAAGLVRSGWLPGPIVEQVSRRAVELLSLEPEAPDPRSGPVPFTSLAAQGDSAPDGVPPDGSGAGGSGEQPGGRSWSGSGTGSGAGAGSGAGTEAWGGRPTETDIRAAGAVPPARAVPPAPESSEAARPKKGRRRVSCTLIVTLACVVVAAALSGTWYLGLVPGLPGFPGQSTGDGGDTAQPAPSGRATPGDTGGGGGEMAALPRGLVGTWQGDVVFDSRAPGGRMTVDFRGGDVGETVATGVTRLDGAACRTVWKLRAVEGGRATLDSFSKSDSQECAGNAKGEVFTLSGDERTLTYRSGTGPGGGRGPSGTLQKMG